LDKACVGQGGGSSLGLVWAQLAGQQKGFPHLYNEPQGASGAYVQLKEVVEKAMLEQKGEALRKWKGKDFP